MKIKSSLLIAGFCGGCVLPFGHTVHAASPLVAPAVAPANDAADAVLTRAEALKIIAGAKKYEAHPVEKTSVGLTKPKVLTPDFDMATPPPAPRSELKPDAPAPGMVWVAGHYMPVKGQWRWVRGEWAVPALPISVWIPAKYDEATKHWDPGYWQPDAPASAEPAADPNAKDNKAPIKAGY